MLSISSAVGRFALGHETQTVEVFFRNVFLAAIAISLGTGLIEGFDIDPDSMFAKGLLVLIGIYARDLLELFGSLIAIASPALGERLKGFIKTK